MKIVVIISFIALTLLSCSAGASLYKTNYVPPEVPQYSRIYDDYVNRARARGYLPCRCYRNYRNY